MIEIFQQFNQEIEEEKEFKQTIKTSIVKGKKIEQQIRIILNDIHSKNSDIESICKKVKEFYSPLSLVFDSLYSIIPSNKFFKYYGFFKKFSSEIISYILLVHFFEAGDLLTKEEIEKLLLQPNTQECINKESNNIEEEKNENEELQQQLQIKEKVQISQTKKKIKRNFQVYDYLIGIVLMSTELSRYCINCVRSQEFELPFKIGEFLNNINSGLKLLNFPNKEFNKHLGSFNYSLKSVEQVLYDLQKIRQFKEILLTKK
ncbi:translin [Anaeramoeba flamelloides]|uniref:Translin n=1 Tax=Anaeramoeba flamelloides TaxID=1746091 RepID=A0AAV8A4D4_9EUKA|nr:translin [Anaeramoeba flamelloides]KAJ6243772.1 translin [Anaeramoeba flamelloides]